MKRVRGKCPDSFFYSEIMTLLSSNDHAQDSVNCLDPVDELSVVDLGVGLQIYEGRVDIDAGFIPHALNLERFDRDTAIFAKAQDMVKRIFIEIIDDALETFDTLYLDLSKDDL